MTDSIERTAWTNDFPQAKSRFGWVDPFAAFMGTAFLASNLMDSPIAFKATNTLTGLFLLLLGVPAAQRYLEHRRPNSIRIDSAGRSVVSTRVSQETLIVCALMCLVLAAAACVMALWKPYAHMPFYNARDRAFEVMALYTFPLLAAFALLIFVLRPWRRRLVFSPDGLAYRRFGPTVFIPWDTIDVVTAVNEQHMKAVVITARPPAQLPALERKKFPDGSTRAKLAIYGMTVDPATIVYLIRRFSADPDVRQLLTTSKHPERLFTGPSWDQRVAMEDGQSWPLPRLEDLAAD